MGRRVRVIQLIYGFGVEGGGAGRFGIELSRALKNEFEMEVWALWKIGTSVEDEHQRELARVGIETFTAAAWNAKNPYSSFWQAFQRMRAALTTKPAGIIHCHSQFADVAALLLKKGLAQPPVIMRTVHNGYRHEWRNRPLRRLVLSNLLYPLMFEVEIGVAPCIVSHLNRRWMARRIGKTALYVPNAINLTRFANTKADPREVKRSLGIPRDAFMVGTIGRLADEKNYACLLQAVAVVLQQLPEVYFAIIGEGKLADALRRLAVRLNIAPHVIFTGPRSDVERLYAAMDLFVSSSLWEGIPTTILESMAAGTPVVATDIPGTRELVRHLTNGWLTPPADSTALARTIVEALDSPTRRADFARAARATVQAYSIERIAAEYRAIYSAAIQRKV